MTLGSVPLVELRKERDAFRTAKTGITQVMTDYLSLIGSSRPDPALQTLIDFADRRINACDVLIKHYEICEKISSRGELW